MYIEKPMIVFLDRLASRSPEPGGGSVAALVAALGAALVSMVGNLTLGKEKYASVQAEIEELLKASEQVRSELQDLLQQDTEVYAGVSAAFKMPRDTEEEKEARRVKVQEGLKAATEVPFRITEKCLRRRPPVPHRRRDRQRGGRQRRRRGGAAGGGRGPERGPQRQDQHRKHRGRGVLRGQVGARAGDTEGNGRVAGEGDAAYVRQTGIRHSGRYVP